MKNDVKLKNHNGRIVLNLGFFLLIQVLHTQNIEFENNTIIENVHENCQFLEQKELFEYELKVGLFPVGNMIFNEKVCSDSKNIYADLIATSKGLGKIFFDLNVQYSSYILKNTLNPIKFIKKINEGGDFKQEEITFTNSSKQAIFTKKSTQVKQVFSSEKRLFDLVSGIAFMRAKFDSIFKNSSSFNIPYVHNGTGIKTLSIDFVGIDSINVSDVYIKTRKFYSVFESSNLMFRKKNEVYFWISDDENRIPLYLETNIGITKLKIELKNLSAYQNMDRNEGYD